MENQSTEPQNDKQVQQSKRPKNFSNIIYITFFWCMIGVSVIYGFRLWHDMPIHPSFIPIIGTVFAGVLSFTLVMALEYVIGPIEIKTGAFEFKGASAPIILWCICFLVIVFGLYLLGMSEITKAGYEKENYKSCSVGDIFWNECSNKDN